MGLRHGIGFTPKEEVGQGKPKLNLRAYDKRNVYKSIIRCILKLVKNNKSHFIEVLRDNGFKIKEIEKAFKNVKDWAKQESQRGKPKTSKKAIEEMSLVKTIHSYILKETLSFMIKGWEDGHRQRILKENFEIYKEVCEEYFEKVKKLIEQ